MKNVPPVYPPIALSARIQGARSSGPPASCEWRCSGGPGGIAEARQRAASQTARRAHRPPQPVDQTSLTRGHENDGGRDRGRYVRRPGASHPIRCDARMGVRRCAIADGQAWRSRPGPACWREAGNCRSGSSADNDRRHSHRPSQGKASDLPAAQRGAVLARSVDVSAEAQVGSVTGQQFLSADGRHVLVSERVADDSVWEKYQWTVYERGSNRRLGALRDYRSHAPFVVVGSSIIYETGPFERRTEQGLISEPLRIRTVALGRGNQLWSRPIRDTTYRGPFPG